MHKHSSSFTFIFWNKCDCLKCGKCGKKSITAIVKSKKFGWICLDCEKELRLKKIKKISQR